MELGVRSDLLTLRDIRDPYESNPTHLRMRVDRVGDEAQ
jgi:hypothetical protein